MPRCSHNVLRFEESDHAKETEYKRVDVLGRLMAAAPVGTKHYHQSVVHLAPAESTFPAPLVLPGDDLASSQGGGHDEGRQMRRQPILIKGNRRRVIYVMPSPTPLRDKPLPRRSIPVPSNEDIVSYLRAFYSPLEVKLWNRPMARFCEWEGEASAIGLHIDSSVTRIRTRVSPDGLFPDQLNLCDLLDAAIHCLPEDAAALLMLSDNDTYEDEDDGFCCGRAFGGSRVSIISTARYNPKLDKHHEIDRVHSWPASHCAKYMDECCGLASRKRKRERPDDTGAPRTAMGDAVKAFASHSPARSAEALSDLWLGRLCKTASHELGHCFGFGHCGLYACVMQGTATIAEDVRQPPYLCHVHTKGLLICQTQADEKTWIEGLQTFCARFPEDAFFHAFLAWLQHRHGELVSRSGVLSALA